MRIGSTVVSVVVLVLAACGGPQAPQRENDSKTAASKLGERVAPSATASAAPTSHVPGPIGRIRRVVTGGPLSCGLSSEGVARCVGFKRESNLARRSSPGVATADVVLQGRIVDLAAGNGGACAVLDNGSVACWDGGDLDDKAYPAMPIPSISGATAIFMDESRACVIVEGGDVACWGSPSWANSQNEKTVKRLGLRDVTSVAPAKQYVCVTHKDGKASCKGDVPWRDKPSEAWFAVEPPAGAGATSFTRVSGAFEHACFETATGAPMCLGSNQNDKITGDTWRGDPETKNKLPDFAARVRRIEARADRTCAINAEGRVGCWGHAYYGEDGVDPDAPVVGGIVPIPSLMDVVDLALTEYHTCALESDGDVYCWGYNRNGELGDGHPIHRDTPVDVGVFEGVEEIHGGSDNTCLLRKGAITCWGSTDDPGPWPALVSMGSDVRGMDLGQTEICGRLDDGAVRCGIFEKKSRCGDKDHRWFCTNVSNFISDAFPRLPGKTTDIAIDRIGNVCALVGGAAYCLFDEGESGTYYKDSWQNIPGVSGAKAIEASSDATCFILGGSSSVSCFRDHRFDEDQDFAKEAPRPKLARVPDTKKVDALAGGQTEFCFLSSGALACFDTSAGPDPSGRWPSPRPIDGLPRADAVAGADTKFCAIHEGKVFCWGEDHQAVGIPLSRAARRIGVGHAHACAWTDDNHLFCWGHDEGGQLGTGRVAMSYRPIRAAALQDAKKR